MFVIVMCRLFDPLRFYANLPSFKYAYIKQFVMDAVMGNSVALSLTDIVALALDPNAPIYPPQSFHHPDYFDMATFEVIFQK